MELKIAVDPPGNAIRSVRTADTAKVCKINQSRKLYFSALLYPCSSTKPQPNECFETNTPPDMFYGWINFSFNL